MALSWRSGSWLPGAVASGAKQVLRVLDVAPERDIREANDLDAFDQSS
jgi:hypothetical protein